MMATISSSSSPETVQTSREVRLTARANRCSTTSGLAPTYLQANLIVLPSRYASDFRSLCARNPVPCPLIAESASVGKYNALKSRLPLSPGIQMATDIDLRRDAPKYNVYVDSRLASSGCPDVIGEWTDDHVAFLIGCSFSFESALASAGLVPRHTQLGRNVPMYRTNIPLCPSGVFRNGTFVVSMRPYPTSDVEQVRDITRKFAATHGEPVAWGWDAVEKLGIVDINAPEFGDAPLGQDGGPLGPSERPNADVPVFWGCGVTPQEAVMRAGLEGTVMAHFPGHMIVLDCRDSDIIEHPWSPGAVRCSN